MTQTAPKVPWIIQFQQKDLLTACWGGEKEANLLYHFLNKASWEAKNQGIESCKFIPFKEEHDKILKLVPMAEGTLIKYLKRFNLAGYVSSGRYGNTFTVNVAAIKAAFTNPPEKPLSAPRGRPKGFKVSRIKKTENTETLENNNETSIITEEKSEVSRISEHEEVSRLNEKVLSLELEVLSLKEKVLNLELLVLNLKLSETREGAPEAPAEAKVSPQNALEMIQTDSEIGGTYSAADNSAQSGTDVPTPARVSHPEHDFIWFDDLVKPTVMWVRYTQAFPGPMFSEYEDKRRSRKSDEVRCFLEGRGINVKLICEHETGDERTIESTPYQPDSYSLNHTEDAFHGTAGSSNHLRWDRTGDLVGTGEHPQSATRDTGCDVRLQPTGTDQTTSAGRAECGAGDARTGTTGDGVAPVHASESGYEKQERPVQATLTGATQQESARRAPVDVTTLTIKAHVNYVFKWLDAVRQKAEENPQASYVQNGTAEKLVRDLINATMNTPNELTERNVHIAWMAMWKSPAGRDGFTWGEPGKISIAAFCRNYGEYLARGRDSLAKKERRSTPSSVPVVGVSGRRNLNISAPVAR